MRLTLTAHERKLWSDASHMFQTQEPTAVYLELRLQGAHQDVHYQSAKKNCTKNCYLANGSLPFNVLHGSLQLGNNIPEGHRLSVSTRGDIWSQISLFQELIGGHYVYFQKAP